MTLENSQFLDPEFDPDQIAAEELRDSAGGPYGLRDDGFVPKPYARLVAEGLARAQQFFGDDIDLQPGSVIRRLIEMSSLEHARSYLELGRLYDASFVSSASGVSLSKLGDELGLPRPFLQAEGAITIDLVAPLPEGGLVIEAGARLMTSGGHHVSLLESARFAAGRLSVTVRVQAFYPGRDHDLDPAVPQQKIERWHPYDPKLDVLRDLAAANGLDTAEEAAVITHDAPLKGGSRQWGDGRYRELLLYAPRSIWTVEAVATTAQLVPGVEEVKVIDEFGGLDIEQSIYGNFNFIERLFAARRDFGSPYSFRVVVKPSPAAFWEGPDGLRAAIAEALEDVRPVGIFPEIVPANEIGVGIQAKLITDGLPLPAGDRASVNASPAGMAFKERLIERVGAYVRTLGFGEPVRVAQVGAIMLEEPGLIDVRDLRLARALPPVSELDFGNRIETTDVRDAALMNCGENIDIGRDQVAVFLDDPAFLEIR